MPREESRAQGAAGKARKGARALTGAHQDAPRKPSSTSSLIQLPGVAVIGAGRLGSALALALAARGCRVSAVVARRKPHARRAAALFKHPRPVALAARELARLPHADLLLISTPDDQINTTAAQLAQVARAPVGQARKGKHGDARKGVRVALHTSGALSSDVLAPLRAAGYAIGSLHPLVSVSDARTGAASLRHAFFCVEGDGRAVSAARKLVRALGGHSFSIRSADKALYHAAAVFASGHTVAIFDLATQLLRSCGVAQRDARRALKPLTQSTLTNLLAARTPAQALTGPFARGDAATVRKNLVALAALADPAALRVYALLGAHALRLARTSGARRAAAAAEIEAMLASVSARAS